MSAGPPAERSVVCPACRGASPYSPRNPWRPFCSERCRDTDLGRWAAEDYRMPDSPASADVPPEHPAD